MSQMQLQQEFILNGEPSGELGRALLSNSAHKMRPYIESDWNSKNFGKPCIDIKTGTTYNSKTKQFEVTYNQELIHKYDPIYNAAVLTKDEWIMLDTKIIDVARSRLKAWQDLVGLNTITIDGFSSALYEYHTASDPGEVMVDMTGNNSPRNDRVRYQLEATPLPITYGTWSISDRELAIARKVGKMETRHGESWARRIAEQLEKTLIGTATGITDGVTSDYGRAATAYGYTNFPGRVTKTDLTTPTTTNGTDILADFLEMRDLMYAQNHYGPFLVYTSTSYDQFLDHDFKTNGDKSTRQRLLEIEGVSSIRRLDYLTSGYQQIWIDTGDISNVAGIVMGSPVRTVQWTEKGGAELFFKTWTIQSTLLTEDFNGNCGIGHATTA